MNTSSSKAGTELLARLAHDRRSRIGLKQDELALYGGPRVTTVGKIERGVMPAMAVRTQHQLENALGWRRGAVRDILTAHEQDWWSNEALRVDFTESLIEDAIPDLSRPAQRGAVSTASELTDEELLTELAGRVRNLKARIAQLEAGEV
jgi:hypothetical protein